MKRPKRAGAAEPTERQLFEAMLAFSTLKMRYQLRELPNAPPGQRFVVQVLPEAMVGTVEFAGVKGLPPVRSDLTNEQTSVSIHRFVSQDAARRWREHEIIRETIKVAMRTKP